MTDANPRPAVIFDMDGVLVASGSAHAASWRIVARKHGIDISDEQFRATFGQTSRDIIRQLFGPGLSNEQIRRIDDEKEATYRELIRGLVPLTIGAREVVAELHRAGFPLAVATSGPPENVSLVLDETRLRRFFQTIVTGADVQRGKPAPDAFLLAAEQLGVRPEHCVVVEDAPAGIHAALAARMHPIGLVGTHPGQRLADAGAERIVQNLTDITPQLVRELTGTQT